MAKKRADRREKTERRRKSEQRRREEARAAVPVDLDPELAAELGYDREADAAVRRAASPRRRRRKRQISLMRFIVFVLICSVIMAVGLSVRNVIRLQKEQERLQQKNQKLTSEKKSLQQEFQHVNDKNYIEEQARKQLKLIKPGETLYILEDDDDNRK